MRTQATIRNALWGILQQAVLCVLGLLSRRVMLQTIGVSGVGLNGLLTNVLSLLSLTEMGVGSVIIYHMYTPLANGDWEEICRGDGAVLAAEPDNGAAHNHPVGLPCHLPRV